jgi:hypothetical protein
VGTCELCKSGYLNFNKNCKSNIDNCDIEKDNKCLFCYDGYVYNEVSNKCEEETETNKRNCYDPNCAICLSEEEGTCEECNKGYKLVKGKCCQPSSESTCLSNTNPYSINCTTECAVCHSDGECIFCRQGYYLKNLFFEFADSKSYKEAQASLQFVTVFSMLPMFLEILDMNSKYFNLIPLANCGIALNNVLIDKIDIVGLLIMLISSIVYVFIIIIVISKQYKSEKTLFS